MGSITIQQGSSLPIGTILHWHTFNGALPVPAKFMIFNGNVVNKTNYDAIHGADTYERDGVANSPLLSKNLPNALSRYLTGAATTTQDGSAPITTVGNSGNQVDLQHTHSVSSLAAAIYTGGTELIYRETSSSSWTATDGLSGVTTASKSGSRSLGTDIVGSLGNGLSTTQSIRPESVETLILIKVA